MKILLSLMLVIVSSTSFAEMSVGTYAIQAQRQVKPDGTVIVRDMKTSVISASADGSTITMRVENLSTGEVREIPDQPVGIEENQIPSATDGAYYVANCAKEGGTLETITVPAGTFETCKFTLEGDSQGFMWIGAVPFGWVKNEIFYVPTGNQNSFELKEIGISKSEN